MLTIHYTFWTGSLSIVSFIASSCSCESAPFCFEGPSEALGVLTNPLSEDVPALFCFSHAFFVPSRPHLLSGSRQKMPGTNRKASSQPIPHPHLLFQPGNTSCHTNPDQTWPWIKPPSCTWPQVLCQSPTWTHPRPAASALSPPGHLCRGDTKEPQCHQHSLTHHQLPPPSRNTSGYSSPQNPTGSEGENRKKGRDCSRVSTAEIPPCPRQLLSKERTSAAGKCHI